QKLTTHLHIYGGAGLIIDYGYYPHQTGESLQAVQYHAPVDIFTDPGCVDLTAHVDFFGLRKIAQTKSLNAPAPITQQEFLLRLGAPHRLQKLLKTAKDKQGLASGFERLISNQAMGQLFKILAVAADTAQLAGFEDMR
ncbi:MAG: SAM-dependent methyltransferase, partial [Pseudomonadota bacterium]